AVLAAGFAAGGNNTEMPDLANAFTASDKRKNISTGTFVGGLPTPYYSSKFLDQAATSVSDLENDWIVIRYADVLLMQAEALNELNKTTEAEPFINLVRQRAGVSDITGLDQANFRL